jgi:MarR family transcriptional regulator, transcriptional regulator for hemolysin
MTPAAFPVPAGLRLGQAARVVSQAFDDALGQAGGSLPVWLVLLNLKVRRPANQRELAAAVGIQEATLTHHLNAMDRSGLITRRRDEANRRIHIVELTPDGEAAFTRLRDAAVAFDRRLTDGLPASAQEALAAVLDRLVANVSGPRPSGAPPWAGLADHAADNADGDEPG